MSHCAELVKRLRSLTLKLLPVEVEIKELVTPTSRIISPHVIQTYEHSAGDFQEAVCPISFPPGFVSLRRSVQLPYCLLQARQSFMWDANHNPADYDEFYGRGRSRMIATRNYMLIMSVQAIACEVLARRIVHRLPAERLTTVMSKRYRHLEWDGDQSELQSALELAIDTHWLVVFLSRIDLFGLFLSSTIFLSSTEAQHGEEYVFLQLFRPLINHSKSSIVCGEEIGSRETINITILIVRILTTYRLLIV